MEAITVIAGLVFRENLRKKVIHVFFVIAMLILIWASTFRVFTLGVQVKFLKDMALFGISFMGILITITATAGQLSQELEHRTIYPLLAKPVTRLQVLAGKFLGALYIIYLNIALMGIVFLSLLFFRENTLDIAILQSIFLIAVECAVVAAFCLLFSTFFSTAANVTATFFLYLLGHVKMAYGDYFMTQFKIPVIHGMVKLIQNPIFPPNLQYFDIKETIIKNIHVTFTHVFFVTLYGIGLVIFFLLIANLIFSKKDL